VWVFKPRGTFFIFPNFSRYTAEVGGDVRLAEYLLEEGKVAVVPGSTFGAEGFFRLSFALDEESIKEGIKRIEATLRSL